MRERVKKSLILLVIGIAVNIALAITKMYVGLSSNSLCIMLDATNSFFDILTGIVTVVAFAILLAPRSEKSPFGYGRSEYLAGFIVAVVSAVVGGVFFMRSLNRLAMPEPVWFGWQNCVLISVAVPVKLGMGLFYYFANRKLKSKALSAIMLDSFLDTGMSVTSVIAFSVSSQVDYAVDSVFGMVMSVIVVAFALKMVYDNAKCVIVGDGAKEEREAISKICAEENVEQVSLVLHDYGYGAKCGKLQITLKDKDNKDIDGNIDIDEETDRETEKENNSYKESLENNNNNKSIEDAVSMRIKNAIKEKTGADVDVYINNNNGGGSL